MQANVDVWFDDNHILDGPEKCMAYRKHGHIRIYGYYYSGYASDREHKKSTTGYCTFIGGNLVT